MSRQQPDEGLSEDDRKALAALRKLLFDATDADPDRGDDVVDAARKLVERVEEVERRVDELEEGQSQLVVDLPTSKRGKREKMYAIVQHAVENGVTRMGTASISKEAAAGAAGCSTRHALNLFDDLAEGFEWAEKDLSRGQARLLIDLEGRDSAAFLDALAKEFPEVERR